MSIVGPDSPNIDRLVGSGSSPTFSEGSGSAASLGSALLRDLPAPVTPRSLASRRLSSGVPIQFPGAGSELSIESPASRSSGSPGCQDRIALLGGRCLFIFGEAFASGGAAKVHHGVELQSESPSGFLGPSSSPVMAVRHREVAHRSGQRNGVLMESPPERIQKLVEELAFEETIHRRAQELAPFGVVRLDEVQVVTQHEEVEGLPSKKGQVVEVIDRVTMDHVMECADASLADMLAEDPRPSLDPQACALSLTRTLAVLHEQGVVHLDLKPQNILMFSQADGTYLAKLCDFGCSNDLSLLQRPLSEGDQVVMANQRLVPKITTPAYTPPEVREVFGGNRAGIQVPSEGAIPTHYTDGTPIMGPKCDVFSLGMVLWEMATQTPLPMLEKRKKMQSYLPARITPADHQELMKLVEGRSELKSEPLIQTALQCLIPDPAQRPADAGKVLEILTSKLDA
ncbi:MAG: protein kinase domain-containing protein, partial [Chlamydiia bacterium]